MTDTTLSLTQKSLDRLKALADGNGLTPEDIDLIESQEAIHTLTGSLTLAPQCTATVHDGFGRAKQGKNAPPPFSSFTELQQEAQRIQKEAGDGRKWLDEAVKELEKTEGHGWGHQEAHLAWSDQETILTATESCPSCRGMGGESCHECHQTGMVLCVYCQARGQEYCTACGGHKHNPSNPNEPCTLCRGTGFILCRYCNGTGKMPCEKCRGRGRAPCTTCHASGFLNREVRLKRGADLSFSLGPTASLPSGLLRVLSRIGNENLYKGHADITLIPPSAEESPVDGRASLHLEAKIPYADLKVRFGKKGAMISCFGKKAKLSGVPPFLDLSLTTARGMLAQAAKHGVQMDAALKPRLMQEALQLILSGKKHPNELRRLYPVGLSESAAQEIMRHMGDALKKETSNARSWVALLSTLVSAGLFAGFFLSPLYATLTGKISPQALWGIEAILPLVVLGTTWALLRGFSQAQLKRRFPQAKISATPSLGARGTAALIVIASIYAGLWWYVKKGGF